MFKYSRASEYWSENQGAFYTKESLYSVAFVNVKSNNKPDSLLDYVKLYTVKS